MTKIAWRFILLVISITMFIGFLISAYRGMNDQAIARIALSLALLGVQK